MQGRGEVCGYALTLDHWGDGRRKQSGLGSSPVNRSAALADAAPGSYWLDDQAAPPPAPPLTGTSAADLTVVGGGYTGLWTALLSKASHPERDVVVLEADRCGWAASGRNGGFCAASLTHGLGNGLERFPGEIATLERLGRENLDGIEAAIKQHSIDCGFERVGEMSVATERYQVEALHQTASQARGVGETLTYLNADEVRAEVHSPTYLAGLWDRDGCALLNPARLAWGLRRACIDAGVRIYEHSAVDGFDDGGDPAAPLVIRTDHGEVRSHQMALATNAHPSPIRRLRRYIVPVYDHVLMTEPLSDEQLDAVGWEHRQGIGGCGNQFVYSRLTQDHRILFGGYDAIYHFGNGLRPAFEQRTATFSKLASLFVGTFPQLDDVRFSHAWAGAIDTCSRFCAFFDRSHGGRVASAAGYTGLGVGASRFGAQVILDLLSGRETELTRLQLVRDKPTPFPPEPLRYAGIQLTRWSMARADERQGRRNLWLRTLDRLGMGFDS
jgi:glycine/D-amino acid oxidase-like deaminating enzyme